MLGIFRTSFVLKESLCSTQWVSKACVSKNARRNPDGTRRVKARKGLPVPKMTDKHFDKLIKMQEAKPDWYREAIMPVSPLSRTDHPVNRFEEEDLKLRKEIDALSEKDKPVDLRTMMTESNPDPYCKEPLMCILCPRRYSVDYVLPSWKNPKLLAQFVSPHTGLTYKKHITGLCESMQLEVEKHVKRAQSFGYMSTIVKDLPYLKDPPLFNPAKPTRRNPY